MQTFGYSKKGWQMPIKLGINGATIPGADLLTGIHVAGAVGFSFYEPRVPRLLECNTALGRKEAQTSLAGEGLEWLPLNGLENVFSASLGGIQQAAHDVLGLAEGFGIRQVIIVPGSVDRTVSLVEAQDTLGALKAIAEEHGINLLYEFIGFPHHAFSSLRQAREVTIASNLPLVLDTFHLAASGTSFEAIQQMGVGEIGLVHLSDALVGDRPISEVTDEDRVLSGEGQLPLPDYLRALAAIGYDGPVSVEVFHPKYEDIAPGKGAREALRSACQALDSVGLVSSQSEGSFA
jgi:sugar phosphate isomerase/epimerase